MRKNYFRSVRYDIPISHSELLDIAKEMGDPKQWLFIKLCQLIEDKNSVLSFRKKHLYKKILEDMKDESVSKLDNLVFPHLSEDEKNELEEIYKKRDKRIKLTPKEKKELILFSNHSGPILSAYMREKECAYQNPDGSLLAYDGKNELDLRAEYNSLNNYRKDSDIYEAKRRIERIMYNSPPLQQETRLYRSINDFEDGTLSIIESRHYLKDCFLEDKGFISTSLVEGLSYLNRKYHFIINAPAGTKGVYIDTITEKYTQQEFILAPGTILKVTNTNVIDKESGKKSLTCDIVSQKEYIPDNVVDLYGLRHISSSAFDYNAYNEKFNQLETDSNYRRAFRGFSVMQFIDYMVDTGILDEFYERTSGMEELYKQEVSQDNFIHGLDHVQRVMLYATYIGYQLNIEYKDYNLLIDAAKYHAIGGYINNDYVWVGDEEFRNYLKHPLDQTYINKINAIIECLMNDDDMDSFLSIFKNYNIPNKEHKKLLQLVSILKDADTLDQTRFINSSNNWSLRNDVAIDLVKTSYQIQEIRGKLDLDKKINSNYFSEEEKQKIYEYYSQGVPYYIISCVFKEFKTHGFDSIDDMIKDLLNSSQCLKTK